MRVINLSYIEIAEIVISDPHAQPQRNQGK